MIRLFSKYLLFPYLLPFFFVLHIFATHYDFIPLKESVFLLLVYLFAAVLLIFVFKLLYKNITKASLLCFAILSFNFLFGYLHDSIKRIGDSTFLAKYIFLLPVLFICFCYLAFYLKKTNKKFTKGIQYLNWLLFILIVLDGGNLFIKFIQKNKVTNTASQLPLSTCDTCAKPDIYLILADEYAGEKELLDIFSFDNNPFLTQLKDRGYHVLPNSTGNYNFTHYAMASMLNMEYLQNINGNHSSTHDLSISLTALKGSSVLNFLQKQGYSFYNYSIFDFKKQSSPVATTFLPASTSPITANTFIGRLKKDLGYHLITTLRLKKEINKIYYSDLYNNEKLYDLTKAISLQKDNNPKFVYTHLLLPHYRYYFNSKSEATAPEKIFDDNFCADKKAYIEYLEYANKKLLSLIDHIKNTSPTPPVIMLLSDHGYHQFLSKEDKKNVDTKYYFMTLNATYFPSQNYSKFYDSMSNVNHFRVVFNSLFEQKLPLLKDSTVFLAQ